MAQFDENRPYNPSWAIVPITNAPAIHPRRPEAAPVESVSDDSPLITLAFWFVVAIGAVGLYEVLRNSF